HLPLVVFTPKSLLRNPEVASPLAAFSQGSFQTVLAEEAAAPEAVRRVIACSGKIYYDLLKARKAREKSDTAIIRVEQLYPFPAAEISAEWAKYPKAQQLRWVQEEPENMGGWTFMEPRLRALLPPKAKLMGISRRESPSPATGSLRRHQQEQAT